MKILISKPNKQYFLIININFRWLDLYKFDLFLSDFLLICLMVLIRFIKLLFCPFKRIEGLCNNLSLSYISYMFDCFDQIYKYSYCLLKRIGGSHVCHMFDGFEWIYKHREFVKQFMLGLCVLCWRSSNLNCLDLLCFDPRCIGSFSIVIIGLVDELFLVLACTCIIHHSLVSTSISVQ